MALSDNLKAYYKLEDLTDASGNGNTLTNNGTVVFSNALINNGADYGTSNTTKSLSIASNLGIDGSAITISTWIKLNTEISSNHYGIAVQGSATSQVNHIISYDYNAGTRRLIWNRQKQNVADNVMPYNITLGTTNWYHIVYTYDGVNVSGYLNGVLVVGPTAQSGNGASGAVSSVYIGYDNSQYMGAGGYSSMLQDETAIWNRALSQAEVSQLYGDGAGTQYPLFESRKEVFIETRQMFATNWKQG